MLTPRFELTQTEDEVLVVIHAPYANIKDTEVHVEECDFRFFSNPYYLRLNLPGKIEENDASTGSYDCEKGDFSMRFSKINKGEHFENLDMISSLLLPSTQKQVQIPNIEVISNPVTSETDLPKDNEGVEKDDNVDDNNDDGDDDDEWFIPQSVQSENPYVSLNNSKYGFANKISRALDAFEESWLAEIIDLPRPDETPVNLRRNLREKHESSSFNVVHYIAEYLEPEQIEECIQFKAGWEVVSEKDVAFSEKEIDILKELPNKEYLLDDKEILNVSLGLVDILFGFCYNHRTTLGESTVESGWTVAKLSSSLSWFETFGKLKDVLIACIRRSLCFPLFRNWNLSLKVIEDIKQVLQLGKKYIVKCLCEIYTFFNSSCEPRYVLNQLYIKDYLIWIQQSQNSVLEFLLKELNEVNLKKEEIGFDLVSLENSAYDIYANDLIIENTKTSDGDLMTSFSNMALNKKPITPVVSDSDDSDSDSDSDSTTSSSSNNSDCNSASNLSNQSKKLESSSESSESLDSDDHSEPRDA